MYTGMTIEELISSVERAERHAREQQRTQSEVDFRLRRDSPARQDFSLRRDFTAMAQQELVEVA